MLGFARFFRGERGIPLKILVVNWRDIRNPEAGGAEVHLHEIFGRIALMGHDVTLVSHHFAGAPREEMVEGMRVVRIGGKFDFNFRALPSALAMLNREKFDVVVEDLNKLPFFISFFTSVPAGAILHHFFGSTIWRETNPLFALYVGLGEWIVRTTHRKVPFCVVSDSTADELTRSGFQKEMVEIIHNAVDHSIYTPGSETSKIRGRIIYLGRVKRYKGIDIILRALTVIRKEIPEAHLVVVGGGDDHERLKKICAELHLDSAVEFTGMVSTESKIEHLRKAQVMVTPSPKEGWGVTTIEANACGTPVIASNVPGLRDAVRDGETGLLFPFGDEKELTRLVVRVLRDDRLRTELTDNALRWASRFRWEKSAEETVAWLQRVVSGGAK